MTERREKMELTEAQKQQVDEVREWLLHLLTESLRAAEMRQGCTNHSYHAEIIADQILSELAILDKDQSLPEIKHERYTTARARDARDHYEAGWNNGVNKAYRLGFRRIIPMEGKVERD